MGHIGPLVEMPLEGAVEKTLLVFLDVGPIPLANEPILLMDDRIVRQHLQGFQSGSMNSLVLFRGDGIYFGQLHAKGYRYVTFFTDNAAVLDGQYRKFAFQRGGFKCISHG